MIEFKQERNEGTMVICELAEGTTLVGEPAEGGMIICDLS
jgi:hypothetical protein